MRCNTHRTLCWRAWCIASISTRVRPVSSPGVVKAGIVEHDERSKCAIVISSRMTRWVRYVWYRGAGKKMPSEMLRGSCSV
ncbi:hypothetical protein HBI07_007820 [Parastagonospora nodorum]|nr:hypothetical protein HBI07_007820 [Parastagonospora nodorum]